jgi:hypothetical protein
MPAVASKELSVSKPARKGARKTKGCVCGAVQHPSFGLPSEGIMKCCANCKTSDMIALFKKLCQCGKCSPTYNLPGEKVGICCKSCKLPQMVNIKDKKCFCGRVVPIFGLDGGKPTHCIKCKTSDMIDLVNRNKMCECGKARATLNYPGENKAKHCESCKKDGMIQVLDKKCKCCKSQPTFGFENIGKAVCCNECKENNMIDVRNTGKMCIKCKKTRATYDIEGAEKARFCQACKDDSMIDLCHTECKGYNNELCPFNYRADDKYDGYCSQCFKRGFSNDPRVLQMKQKTKEIKVRDFINTHFEGFIHDKPLWTTHCDCSIRRRIDHRLLIDNTLLVVETDENQHKNYDEMDEQIRYDDLYMAFSGKWIYIRFNPDKYKNSKGKLRNTKIDDRLLTLKREIEKQILRIKNDMNAEILERVYLYYDGYEHIDG